MPPMKKSLILLIVFLSGAVLFAPACSTANETSSPSPVTPTTAPSLIPNTSQASTSAHPTPLSTPSPSATPLPSPTPSPSSTYTTIPFLPADLAVIGPQNASRLNPVAVLPAQGASVVSFSSDHRLIAAGFFINNSIKIWELASGRELFTLSGHTDPRIISYLAFSPDSARLASGAQGWDAPNDSLILWNTGTGRELQRFTGVLGAISPDWFMVALAQREQKQGVNLVLSDLVSGKEIYSLKAPGDVYDVCFSPDGKLVAAKMYNVFQDLFSFWSVDSGRLKHTQYDWLEFSFSPDGRFIGALLKTGSGSDKGELNIFDAKTFKWIKTVAKDADALWYTYPAFSPDGQVLTASFGDHSTLWDTQTWKELTSLPASGPTGFAFSQDGLILTTFSRSDPVQLWGILEGQ